MVYVGLWTAPHPLHSLSDWGCPQQRWQVPFEGDGPDRTGCLSVQMEAIQTPDCGERLRPLNFILTTDTDVKLMLSRG